jgi:hypothetical protein
MGWSGRAPAPPALSWPGCVQRGIATQFLDEETFVDAYQCRVWWWLSLALYVKAMRTPWVLNTLADDTAFVGLGFSIDPVAEKGKHVVLGCSHIYSGKGEGLQYRLTKIEDPIFPGRTRLCRRTMPAGPAKRSGNCSLTLASSFRTALCCISAPISRRKSAKGWPTA